MQLWLWIAALVALPFVLWGLHRFCLRLEERGYLYYLHKKPTPGGSSALLGMQEFIQPNAQQIVEALDHRSEMVGDEGATGDPPHHVYFDLRAVPKKPDSR
jgi:hypothetical protein